MEFLPFPTFLGLAALTLVGAALNGVLGFGFAAAVLPLALLIWGQTAWVPALLLLDVTVTLWVVLTSLGDLEALARRSRPTLLGLLLGLGAAALLHRGLPGPLLPLLALAALLGTASLASFRATPVSGASALLPGLAGGLLDGLGAAPGGFLALHLPSPGSPQDQVTTMAYLRLWVGALTILGVLAQGKLDEGTARLAVPLLPIALLGVGLGQGVLPRLSLSRLNTLTRLVATGLAGLGLASLLRPEGRPLWVALLLGGLPALVVGAHLLRTSPRTLPEAA